ncbi:hypothetical protein NQ176_g5745 [Zarea fungicola]|uniref:Uncharacterized protein n=1 Tax=Zarea fungicola TaxID=93591 RepID=A0ACC1N800_9HYPO|nr:hypothetical protein NQ176_g5745 [Lecanicillium fungicola]
MRISSLAPVAALLGMVNALPATDSYFGVPNTVVLDGYRLIDAKIRLFLGSQEHRSALKHLTAQADSWLSQGPWSVTTKTVALPPSASVQDYISQAPFFWPNPATPDGCPWAEKDGIYNPDSDKYPDRMLANRMFNSTYVLSLAWYYTGNAAYSKHAADILRTWFLDPKTGMNPSLNFGQVVPCTTVGRSYGIIDFSQEYSAVLDAVAILSTGAPGWTRSDTAAFKAWNTKFLTWLTESPYGKTENSNPAEHGTLANFQITALALFLGNKTLAQSTAQVAHGLIDSQINVNGSQPKETGHTRSWHYSNLNLGAYLRWALVAKKVGVDLLTYTGPQGQSIFTAANFVLPAAVGGQAAWPFKEIDFKPWAATDNLDAAADFGFAPAEEAKSKFPAPPGGNIFALRPAPQQLDSIIKIQ